MADPHVPTVRRIRVAATAPRTEPPQGMYRGFGSVPGETVEEFHDRMYEIDPLEAMMYELEVTLEKSD